MLENRRSRGRKSLTIIASLECYGGLLVFDGSSKSGKSL